ncbi:MAG: DEAD/DEAH box helicase family protein, partial [bacterium]
MAQEQFVQVAFPLPVEKTFTYVLPPSLRGRVSVGTRVTAPLGRRNLPGVVTEVREAPPAELGDEIKAIESCLDKEPMVGPDMLGLTRWVAGYYLAGHGEVLKAALPAGLDKVAPRIRRLVRLAGGLDLEEGLDALRAKAPVQARIIEALTEEGEKPLAELRRIAPGVDGAVRALRSKGIVEEVVKEIWRRPAELASVRSTAPPTLTAPQEEALAAITQAMEEGAYRGFLLHGVTGSGKTEIYLRTIGLALERGR